MSGAARLTALKYFFGIFYPIASPEIEFNLGILAYLLHFSSKY